MIAFSEEDFFAEPHISGGTHPIFSKRLDEKSFLVALFNDESYIEEAELAFDEIDGENFRFKLFIEKFLLKSEERGLPEFSFLFISAHSEIAYLINNMPPILIGNIDGTISKLQESKKRVTSTSFSIATFPFLNASNILLCNKNIVVDTIHPLFSGLFSKKEVLDTLNKDKERAADLKEDLNFVFINSAIKKYIKFSIHEKIESKISAVSEFEEKLNDILVESFSDNVVYNTNTSLVFSELILNAFEHGVLNISPEQKQELILEDKFDEYILEEEQKTDKKIDVSISFYDDKILKITINDHGDGFDYYSYMSKLTNVSDSSFRGRGLIMSLNICTALFYSERGNKVTYYVRYKEEDSQTDFKVDEEAYLRSLTALYVEDDEFIRSSMTHMLKRDVKTLLIAEDGAEGLALYKKYKPKLIITDVEMPKLDGLDMTEEIKKDNPEAKIVITTGYSSEEFLMKAIDVGVDKFLVKPISVSKLRKTLRDLAKSIFYHEVATKQANINMKNMSSELNELKATSSHLTAIEKSTRERQQLVIKDNSELLENLKSEIYYKTEEALSGDIYGLYKIDEDRTFIFIIDSMGKGVNASITPLISSVYINSSMDIALKRDDYNFEKVVNYYGDYIKNYILDEECISITFIEIDTKESILSKAGFGMFPTIILDKTTQETKLIKSLNPPYSKHKKEETIFSSENLPKEFSILTFSDTIISEGKLSMEFLENKLQEDITLADLLVAGNSGRIISDDLTIIKVSTK